MPDFDVHPRNLENWIRDWAVWDTLRIDNGGDEELVWELEVTADVEGWIVASPLEGRTPPGERNLVVVVQDGRELEDGHYYADLNFTSNDPTREHYTVPVVGHTVAYPRIAVGWPEGWGEWWGVDMNYIFEQILWGRVYRFNITIGNPGGAQLDVEALEADNGYYGLDPAQFQLDPGSNRQVEVTFTAAEVGPHSTTVISVSNAWDPRELSFRIRGYVDPVFCMGTRIPDLEMDEDAPERLVADLDTVFISSDRSRELRAQAPGFLARIERSGEFYLAPRLNWNGVSQVVVSATLEDSTLSDTFQVMVNPVPDPPGTFDLLHPADGDTIHFGEVDSLRLFIWQAAPDPDGDTVSYQLSIHPVGIDTIYRWSDIADTSYTRDILGEILNPDFGGIFEWTVEAGDGMFIRYASSTFTNYIPPAGVPGDWGGGASDFRLVELYPNPFNLSLTIRVNLVSFEPVTIEIYDLGGRFIERVAFQALPRSQTYNWSPPGGVSGRFLVRVEAGDRSLVYPVTLLR